MEQEISNFVNSLIVVSASLWITNHPWKGRDQVVRSLRAGVQLTLDLSAEAFISVQCASPGRGGEFVGVCGVCAPKGARLEIPDKLLTPTVSFSTLHNDTIQLIYCIVSLCRVEEGTVGVSSLSGISKRAPLGVTYRLAKPGLALI